VTGWRARLSRRRLLAAAGLLVLVAAALVAVVDPFSGGGGPNANGLDNGAPVSLQTVVRRSLSSQTQVSGTLQYADSTSVELPAGTAPSSLEQAQQGVTSAKTALGTAQATLAADTQTLAQAQAKLTADRLKEQTDCAGSNAAQTSASGTGGSGGGGGSASPCSTAAQAAATDQEALPAAQQKVTADTNQVAGDRAMLAGARKALAAAEASATPYDTGATYTMLPDAGTVIRRGHALYAVGSRPVVLLYGPVSAWRSLRPGMSPGRDVAELNANLDALGYANGLAGDAFTAATGHAVEAFQAAHGLARTGILALGSVAFMPGAVRIASVTAAVGQAVQAGAVLTVTSTRHEVAIQLDAAQQSQVAVGDRVTITLPDQSTTPGVVSKVGKVATVPSSNDQGGGGPSTPTIEVDVRLLNSSAAGSLDQAPVDVSITTASVHHVLVAPVNALLALAGGGYALEAVDKAGVHRLVAATPGLFDDADGLVQVSGPGLHAGLRVVVPSS
jgi:peptidoglycan hydrolase-like protein with peptidoglycan-binding domain